MSAIFHTTLGDFEISLINIYKTPKSAKNFLALCASNYYNDCQIVKNIKGFIFQTGDPTNTGHGGESIYKEVTLTRTSRTSSMMNSDTNDAEWSVGPATVPIPMGLSFSCFIANRSKFILCRLSVADKTFE
jgi:cyclophilin family peptidyl-prolyl cis-trans isomerase